MYTLPQPTPGLPHVHTLYTLYILLLTLFWSGSGSAGCWSYSGDSLTGTSTCLQTQTDGPLWEEGFDRH